MHRSSLYLSAADDGAAAFAAEYGEPDITPQTTMGEIRSNPSILGAGVWTYSKEQNLPRHRGLVQ